MSTRSVSWGRRAYYGVNGFILVFLLGPLLVVAVFSLNPTPYIQFPPVGVTLHWYEKFFASYEFMNSLWLSLRVAAAVVVLLGPAPHSPWPAVVCPAHASLPRCSSRR
jgi:putative spermidine/putrescine transport system permease protein